MKSEIDSGQLRAGLGTNVPFEQFDSADSIRLLGLTHGQARAGGPINVNPITIPNQLSQQFETGQPVAQMLSDWSQLAGKISEPLNIGQAVALAPDSIQLTEFAPERSHSGQVKPPPTIEEENGVFGSLELNLPIAG